MEINEERLIGENDCTRFYQTGVTESLTNWLLNMIH